MPDSKVGQLLTLLDRSGIPQELEELLKDRPGPKGVRPRVVPAGLLLSAYYTGRATVADAWRILHYSLKPRARAWLSIPDRPPAGPSARIASSKRLYRGLDTTAAAHLQASAAGTALPRWRSPQAGTSRAAPGTRPSATARPWPSPPGFPMRERPDAATYSVPIKRKTIVPRRTTTAASAPFRPEPALDDAQYEAALEVLRRERNALERSPRTSSKMGEEQIRDLLLVHLNGHFEGQAAGEVFNNTGKTDILVRVEDRHIFIGECKIWKGPKTIPDTLDQLLKYLTWRDTKAALLLFIRSGVPGEIMSKAIDKFREHPNYKRDGQLNCPPPRTSARSWPSSCRTRPAGERRGEAAARQHADTAQERGGCSRCSRRVSIRGSHGPPRSNECPLTVTHGRAGVTSWGTDAVHRKRVERSKLGRLWRLRSALNLPWAAVLPVSSVC